MFIDSHPTKGKTKVQKIFWVFIRFVIPLAALGYIIYSLRKIPADQVLYWQQTVSWSYVSVLIIAVVLALTAVNWLLEALKWQKLARRFEPVSLKQAYAGVLFGISLGMITPRRSGEFAGRVVVLKPENQVRGMVINTAGSFTQFLITLLFGHVGVALALLGKAGQVNASREGQLLLYSGLALVLAVLLVLYAKSLLGWLQQKSWFPKRLKIIEVVMTLTKKEMAVLFSLSALRYFIFITQFHLLLTLFGIQLMVYDTFMVLSIIYLIMVGIPVSGLAEVGIRGSVALFVFSLYLGEKLAGFPAMELTIVSATLLLWFVNLALPGMLGAILSLSGKLKMSY
ncbi:MAG: flippase-like domain-containing protein [Bacteroidales bacterium]|nr:flippase-like domain-containing protein [Bacteroidales bacterium]